MNLIDPSITPDPFNPQPGDSYEYEGNIAERIVVTSVDLTDGTYVPAQICFERNGISSARDRVNFTRDFGFDFRDLFSTGQQITTSPSYPRTIRNLRIVRLSQQANRNHFGHEPPAHCP